MMGAAFDWTREVGFQWAQMSTYNAAISACEKGLQGRQAFCVSAVMHQTAVMPDVISYNAAISACEKVPPYILIYSVLVTAISASERGKQWQQALRPGDAAAKFSDATYPILQKTGWGSTLPWHLQRL